MKITLTKVLKRKLIETAKTDIKYEGKSLLNNKKDQFQIWKFDGGINQITATRIHYNEDTENILKEKYLFSLDETLNHFKKIPNEFFELSGEEIWEIVERSLTNKELGTFVTLENDESLF